MNTKLREEIVRHVFSNFAIIPSDFVNLDKSKSLLFKEYLLADKITFVDADNNITKNNVWGCQISTGDQEIKIILGECTQEENIPEYALFIHVKGAPAYGLYLVYNNLVNSGNVDSEALIAITMDGKNWLECQTFLQATFLMGMEQIRDVGLDWDKCSNYKDQFDSLLLFIKFHHSVYEDKDEG